MIRRSASPVPVFGQKTIRNVAILGCFLALGLVATRLFQSDPIRQDLMLALAGPSLLHPFGFDHLGRDVWLRMIHGAPRSLGLAGISVALSLVLGLVLGMVAARLGRWTDALIMRLADLTLAFPGILLALFLASFMGGGILPVLIGINMSLWPQFARLARTTAKDILAEPHVEAAYLAGFSTDRILRHHVLLPIVRQVLPLTCLSLAGSILSISSLGFLGLGLQPPAPEWGQMISEMLPYLHQAPWQMAGPCLAILISVLSFFLIGQRMTAGAERSELHK
jgi:peptide/nickel transport system permease protein